VKLSNQHKAALASYARSAVGAIAAVVATGNYAPKDLAKAAVAALLPPLIRWANPKDSSFGRGA